MTQDHKPDYNDGNWHDWNGGECPDSIHPASLVEYVWNSLFAEKAVVARNETRAIRWSQVIRFRVLKPYHELREWWLDELTCRTSPVDSGKPRPEGCILVREVKE